MAARPPLLRSPKPTLAGGLAAGALLAVLSPPGPAAATELTVDATEAEAALAVLAKVRAGEDVEQEDWSRIFATEGYRRLGERERSMDRRFEEGDFRGYLLSDEVVRRTPELEATLAAWKKVEFSSLARRILDYLPPGAELRATIYPVIKPQPNSFVFDVTGEPAIFLFLDPEVGAEKFANTVLHELHHIGFGGSCPPPQAAAAIEGLPEPVRRALRWLGAFGEGFAMLAAAGGAGVHPHAVSSAEDRRRWDGDLARFAEQRRELEAFFLDLLAGRLDEEQELRQARAFFGVQGPWYTVGWSMAATLESTAGRSALIEAFCDSRRLLAAYNQAVREREGPEPQLWSRELLDALAGSCDATEPCPPTNTSREDLPFRHDLRQRRRHLPGGRGAQPPQTGGPDGRPGDRPGGGAAARDPGTGAPGDRQLPRRRSELRWAHRPGVEPAFAGG